MSSLIFEHKHEENNFIIEMRIFQVKKDKYFPEGIKYSLVAVDKTTKKRLLGFDNHEKKGHHIHRLDREIKYDFKDHWKLIEDFNIEYEKLKKRLLR